jgi:hypothetical protein
VAEAGPPARPASTRRRTAAWLAGPLLVALGWPAAAAGQTVEQRGFIDTVLSIYPLTERDDVSRAVAEGLVRWDPSLRAGRWRFDASFDVRFDSDDMTERRFAVTWWDRTIQRPVAAVRQASASWARGAAAVTLGKQFIRWGKTDILIPTDRFAPRDYLNVVETDVFGVTAARVVLTRGNDSLDLVYVPKLTPSRIPLFDQRWVVLPPEAAGLPLVDDGAAYAATAQIGGRWNHIGRYHEHSLSYYRGLNHLPLIDIAVAPSPVTIHVRRRAPQLTSVGVDAAVPLSWVAVKGEAAWLGSETADADELILFVVQLERQVGEWLFVGGYAGEYVIEEHLMYRFAPDRGLARSIVGRAGLTIDTNRSLTFEAVLRQDGDGFYGTAEYSQAVASHWRFTGTLAVFAGSDDDFLGQFRHNSFLAAAVRYSF